MARSDGQGIDFPPEELLGINAVVIRQESIAVPVDTDIRTA